LEQSLKFILSMFLLGFTLSAKDLESGQYTIKQSWSQESNYQREYLVRVPVQSSQKKMPVFIFLHGNGGKAERALNNFMRSERILKDHFIIVFPQGYKASWNIVSERSKANDLAFVEAIIKNLQEYDNVQQSNFSIMGNSNGAALVNQIAIETRMTCIRNYISAVSPLNTYQYDGQHFKFRGEDNNYVEKATPLKGIRLLNISGTQDALVPYEGGESKRIPAKDGKLAFVAAEESTFIWAKAMGFKGSQVKKGESLDKKIEKFSYLNGNIVHYKVDAGHGAGAAISDALLCEFLLGTSSR
jgi:poly(3-hydroxybutyrate) depolymerase